MLKATRILVKETGGRVFIMGRADQGPVALALALLGPENFLLAAGEEACGRGFWSCWISPRA